MKLIIISLDVQKLTGRGEEYLIDKEGNVIAKFYDGSFSKQPIGNSELTVEAA